MLVDKGSIVGAWKGLTGDRHTQEPAQRLPTITNIMHKQPVWRYQGFDPLIMFNKGLKSVLTVDSMHTYLRTTGAVLL